MQTCNGAGRKIWGRLLKYTYLRYTYHHSDGSVSVDQESTIHRLLEKYGLTNCNPAEVPIDLTLPRWTPKVVYFSNYWKDDNQECREHASRWTLSRCNLFKFKIQLCSESVLRVSLIGKSHQSSVWSAQANSQYLAWVKHMRLTWCATAALNKRFQSVHIYSYADTSWADDRNSLFFLAFYLFLSFSAHTLWVPFCVSSM